MKSTQTRSKSTNIGETLQLPHLFARYNRPDANCPSVCKKRKKERNNFLLFAGIDNIPFLFAMQSNCELRTMEVHFALEGAPLRWVRFTYEREIAREFLSPARIFSCNRPWRQLCRCLVQWHTGSPLKLFACQRCDDRRRGYTETTDDVLSRNIRFPPRSSLTSYRLVGYRNEVEWEVSIAISMKLPEANVSVDYHFLLLKSKRSSMQSITIRMCVASYLLQEIDGISSYLALAFVLFCM